MGFGHFSTSTWVQLVDMWSMKASKSSQMGQILGLLPVVITWLLWLRKCRARIEGRSETVNQVWMRLKHWIAKIGEKLKVS